MSKVRWYRGEMTGTLAAKVRWYRAEMAGTADTVVLPFTPVTCEAEAIVPLAAVLASGATADLYVWRRVSGPTSTVINGSGASVTVKAPSTMPPGATVVIGVTATKDSVASVERTVTLTVYPQINWSRVHPATAWSGSPLNV